QAALAESQQLWLELNNLPMLADNLCNNCGFCVLTGQYDQALALSEKAFNLSRSIDNLWDQSYSRFYAGYVYFDRGEMDEALRTMDECRTLGEQAGFLVAMMQARAEMALVYATLGDLRRAYKLTDEIFARLKELQKETHPYTWGLLAYLNVLDGNLERADAILQRFPAETDPGELTSGGVFVPLAQTELALKQENYPQVIELTERFKVVMRQRGIHQYLPDVLVARSR